MKFQTQLARANKTIREERALRIAEAASDSQTKLIMDLKSQKRNLQNKLDSMTDLSTDNTSTTTNIISADWNPDSFMKEIQSLKVEIVLVEQQIKVAETTQKEWFDEPVS